MFLLKKWNRTAIVMVGCSALLLSFVAGLAGMFMGSIAGWFAWPAVWLLTYMVDVVNVLPPYRTCSWKAGFCRRQIWQFAIVQ